MSSLKPRNDVIGGMSMGIISEIQRAHARQVRARHWQEAQVYRQQQQMHRQAERAFKAAQRAAVADERERKRLYVEARAAEVAANNAVSHPPFNPGTLGKALPPPDWQRFEPPAPTGLSKVDVSSVRDLFGTLQNEGASKGILVTTSAYGPPLYEFASGNPLELIDGSNLLYLLAEHK